MVIDQPWWIYSEPDPYSGTGELLGYVYAPDLKTARERAKEYPRAFRLNGQTEVGYMDERLQGYSSAPIER